MRPSVTNAARLTRRAALGAIGAAGAAAILWPAGDRRGRAPAGRVEVTYWEKWTGREGGALQAMVDRYNQSQDRAWVRLVPVGDITSKAMVAIGGGDPPDVVGLYTYNVPGYAEARAVMDLSQFAPLDTDGALNLDRFAAGVRGLLTHEGRHWAGVNTCYTLALYYNPALFREAGLDPGRPPRTIGELDEAAQRLTRRAGAGGPSSRIEQAGFLQNLPGWWPYVWPFLFGGRLFDEATNRATIGEAECVAAFEWIRRTAERYGAAATRSFAAGFGRSIHSAEDPFISGRVAMIVQGPWLVNFIQAYRRNLEVAAAPVPESAPNAEAPTGLLEADVLMIPRGCRHPEEAFRFLAFMQRREIQEQLARLHCKPSPLAEQSPEFLALHPSPTIGVHQRIVASPRARILPRTRVWKAYSDLIVSAFDAVWSGADPSAELSRVAGRAQVLMDAAAARRAGAGGGRSA